MKCGNCGNELKENVKYCEFCGAPVDGAAQNSWTSSGETMYPQEGGQGTGISRGGLDIELGGGTAPAGKKKTGLIIGAAAAAVAVVGAAAFGMLSQKDPKEVVISAFENIYQEGQTDPMEELFGISEIQEKWASADVESNATLILDECSEASLSQLVGGGIRIQCREDRTNKDSATNFGLIYKDMDLANLNLYYGDDTVMMSLPELSDKVFTLDIGDGLEERLASSPFIGPVMEETGRDMLGLVDYVKKLQDKRESGGRMKLDLDTIRTRFKEGSQAQEKFKEALVVEKGEKAVYVVDGKEADCRGYKVTVSKDSMMEFLRSSADFFLNDQELKDQYLDQLELSVRITEVVGGSVGLSAPDMYLEAVEDAQESVEEMIEFLDKALTDVDMDVYVDKKGRLAAVKGATVMNGETETMDVTFDIRLEGGSYLTQNLLADVTLKNSQVGLKCSLIKRGTYDGKKLTSDLDLTMTDGETIDAGAVWTGTYESESGDYHMDLSLTDNNAMVLGLSMAGAVDQLEKGSSFHMDIDQLKVSSMEPVVMVALRGDFSLEPLAEPVKPLEGEIFDTLAADENQWQSVIMEFYMSIMKLANQLSL